jgi:hypothetical protein
LHSIDIDICHFDHHPQNGDALLLGFFVGPVGCANRFSVVSVQVYDDVGRSVCVQELANGQVL